MDGEHSFIKSLTEFGHQFHRATPGRWYCEQCGISLELKIEHNNAVSSAIVDGIFSTCNHRKMKKALK
jgi:hypothetical protein